MKYLSLFVLLILSTSIFAQTNVALSSNGGVATASSTYSSGYSPSGTINGDEKGTNWSNGGGWNDATSNSWPDWLQVNFSSSQTISQIIVFSVQDNFSNPVQPTDTMTFSLYGLVDFTIQGWNGSSWDTLGTVTGNNLVKRTINFSPYTTDRIRLNVTYSLNGYSRSTEIEAWTSAPPPPPPPPPSGSVFNEVEDTSTANSTVPVDALVVANSATNVDIAIVPKGTGAIIAQIPDGTVANGVKRGASATDFQRARIYATDVASGQGATISGGSNSVASGLFSTVVGGYDNEASGIASIVGGQSSVASGQGAPVAFGYDAQARGDSGVALGHNAHALGTDAVAIGRMNVATGDNSVAIGWDNLSDATQSVALGTQATTRGIHGAFVIADGMIVSQGDNQRGLYIVKGITTDGNQIQLTTDAVIPSLSRGNIITLPDDSTYAFSGRVVARELATGSSATWKFEGMAKRGIGASSTTQSSVVTLVISDIGSSWLLSIVADTSNGSIALLGTGQTGKTIQWVATVETVENVGN